MTNLLLLLNIHIKVSNHDNAAFCADAFLAAGKLARFHIALENIHTIFLVKRNT